MPSLFKLTQITKIKENFQLLSQKQYGDQYGDYQREKWVVWRWKKVKGGQMVTEGDLTWGGEHTIE